MGAEVRVVGMGRERRDPESFRAPDAAAESALEGIRATVVAARQQVFTAINTGTVLAYWDVGRQIVETQGGRAEYGKRLLHFLAGRLTAEFGPGYDESNLRNMRRFYGVFPIQETLSPELSWSHYLVLARISDQSQREFYAHEAIGSGWTVRQLRRQVTSLYYERSLGTRGDRAGAGASEVMERPPGTIAHDLLKDPYVLEFLNITEPTRLLERDLEQGLVDKLQAFMLELGRGFSFVARQRRISSDNKQYWVDLVFYNYLLKCFVLIDLKVGDLTHQDVGQMDFYRRIFDDKVRPPGDNPTIGIILCSSKDEAIAKYSILADDVGVYAAGYKTYLPTEEELRRELELARLRLELDRPDEDGDS